MLPQGVHLQTPEIMQQAPWPQHQVFCTASNSSSMQEPSFSSLLLCAMAFSRSYFCYTGRKADLLRRMAKIKKKQRCEHRRKKQTNNSRHQKETGGSDSGAHRCLEDPKRQRSTGATVDPVSASEATGSGPPPSLHSFRTSFTRSAFVPASERERDAARSSSSLDRRSSPPR